MSDAEFLERIASYMGRDDYRDRLRAIASRLTAPEPSVTALWCSLDIVAHEMDQGIYRDDAPDLIRKAALWIKDVRLTPPEPSVDAAYVRLSTAKVDRTQEVIESVLFVDYDSEGNAVGIEVLTRGIESTL